MAFHAKSTKFRLAMATLAVSLVAAACTDDQDGSASTTAAGDGATTTVEATTTTAPAPTTSIAGSTTTTGDDSGEAPRGEVTLRMVTVGDPGNASVGVLTTFVAGEGQFVQIPEDGGIYESCDDAPPSPPECIEMGGVDYEYQIGELEITVEQYVAFLNTVDPEGRNEHRLYHDYMNSQVWPKYGSIDYDPDADLGAHFSVAYPEWTNKPFGFADFRRAARFANSLFNGEVLSVEETTEDEFAITTYQVRLSPESERGMYDLTDPETTRQADSGFVIPSNDEWAKAAYYDPSGGGQLSYWQYPTGPTDAPNASQLDPETGDVVNADTQPLSTYSPQGPPGAEEGTYPNWCPSQAGESACEAENPYSLPPGISGRIFQGNLSTVGQTLTRSPWGTLDQGGNVVEWQDTIVPSFQGFNFHRVWRHMHGGVANAAAYQLLISAIGFQPQDQVLLDSVYPWFGFRVGIVGELG